jgi:kynureninase
MSALRARSVALTGYLEGLLRELSVEIVTPSDPAARGAQLSLRSPAAERILAALATRGVVADLRAPDLIRVAPVPLYTTYHEAWRFAATLREVLPAS